MFDFVLNGAGHGSVAEKILAHGGDVRGLRPFFDEVDGKLQPFLTVNKGGELVAVPTTNATLRKDEWIHYDKAVLQVTQQRMIGVSDLESRGLVYAPGGGLANTVLQFEDASDVEDATLSMDGLNRGNNDRQEYDLKGLPLPIIHKDFQINARALAASRMNGSPMDTSMAQVSARKVTEKIETLLFQGSGSYKFGGYTLYGYADHPNRNTVSIGTNWDALGVTGDNILQSVLEMKQALIDDGYYGPYVLYIPTAYETKVDEDFKANSDKTIRQRLLEVGGIEGVKVADKLSANTVVLVQMSSDVVRMVNVVPVTTVQWDAEGGMAINMKIMCVKVPQIRADQDGNSGVCVLS